MNLDNLLHIKSFNTTFILYKLHSAFDVFYLRITKYKL